MRLAVEPMSNLSNDPQPPAPAVPGERWPQLVVALIALGFAIIGARRPHGMFAGVLAASAVLLAFWLGRQLGRAALGVLASASLAAALLAGVNFEWNAAALLALAGAVAARRWRDDPAPALAVGAIGAWLGALCLIWPR